MSSNLNYVESKNFEIRTDDLLNFIKSKKRCYDIQLYVTDFGEVCGSDNNGNIKFHADDIIDLVVKEIGYPIRTIIPNVRESYQILYFIEYIEPCE